MSFKKIVAELSYSPSTVGQLSMLAKKNKKEELTRRICLFILIPALAVQFMTLSQPPESSNSASITEMLGRGYPAINLACDEVTTDLNCASSLKLSLTALNASQGNVAASTVVAEPNDQIIYSISVQNTGHSPISIHPAIKLADILEYAELVDKNGGTIDNTKNLSWPKIYINSGDSQTRNFTIRLLNNIPLTASGKYYYISYDCKMTSIFGNITSIPVACPAVKNIEEISSKLPSLSIKENLILTVPVVFITMLLYVRSRQIRREINQIRNDENAGVI
jgi:uncharacterized repeat protein (TIGR01451 family)